MTKERLSESLWNNELVDGGEVDREQFLVEIEEFLIMLKKLNPYLIFIIVFIIEVVLVSIFLEELVAGLFGGMMMIIVVLFFHFFIASIFFYLEKLKMAYCVLINILIVPVFFLLMFFRSQPDCILEELTAEEVAERSCKRYLNNNVPAVSINHIQINELTDSMKAEVAKKIEEGVDIKQATMEVNIYYSVDTEELILCKCLTDENGVLVWPR